MLMTMNLLYDKQPQPINFGKFWSMKIMMQLSSYSDIYNRNIESEMKEERKPFVYQGRTVYEWD